MPVSLLDAAKLTDAQFAKLSQKDKLRLRDEWLAWAMADRKAMQLWYYAPASPQAMAVHRSTAREVGIQGGNRCQPAGTRVVTGRGILPIEEVKVGDVVGREWGHVVRATYRSPTPEPLWRLTTKRGYSTRGNAEHPLWIAPATAPGWHGGVTVTRRLAAWRRLPEATPGEFVALRAGGRWPEGETIPEDDAYFLGLMTGDGCWTGGYGVMKFAGHADDTALTDWLATYLQRRGIASRLYARGGKGLSLEWCDLPFKREVEGWGVPLVHGPDKAVPEPIWRGSRATVAAFVRGLADTDGCATTKPSVVWISRSRALLAGVQHLLLRFGVVSSLREQPAHVAQKRPNPTWRLEASGKHTRRYAADIGFLLERKRARLPTLAPCHALGPWDRVARVERDGEDYVYGLTVEGVPEYLADGFLQHNSGKSDVMLVEWAIQATGVVPKALEATYPREKLRPPPTRSRLFVASLETAWDQNLKPKLQPWVWNGRTSPGVPTGDPTLGHWGWVPESHLPDGGWDKAWSEKHRLLTLRNGSTLHIMSHNQDGQDYAQGTFDLILEDEIPSEAIHRENRMRVLDRKGRILTGGTPADTRGGSITHAWFYDEILVPGMAGEYPDDVFAVQLMTAQNRILDPEELKRLERTLSPEAQAARLRGEFLHLSGLIWPEFTIRPKAWCYGCRAAASPKLVACPTCERGAMVRYSHVWDDGTLAWPGPSTWPILFYMDPHQSKPTACAWFKVDPDDRWWQIAELEVSGNAAEVKRAVEAFEAEHEWTVAWRKADPKVTIQTNQFAREVNGEPFNIRRAFEEVGFDFEEANTNFIVARDRVSAALEPQPHWAGPRLRIAARCERTLYQMTHFIWETARREDTVPRKEVPSRKHSDFPALLRYLAMDDPTYREIRRLGQPTRLSWGDGLGRSRATGW